MADEAGHPRHGSAGRLVLSPDEHHAWARRTFAEISPGGFICEAVIAEVCHLVAKEGIARGRVLEFVERGGLTVFPLGGELPAVRTLLDRYADTPMAFADACVVRLSELHADLPVCTTDGHFRFFRKHGSDAIPLVAPFAV